MNHTEQQEIENAIENDVDAYIEAKNDRHMIAGLSGVRCGYIGNGNAVKVGLSWDTITCPDCLAKKRDDEPESVDVPTLGD